MFFWVSKNKIKTTTCPIFFVRHILNLHLYLVYLHSCTFSIFQLNSNKLAPIVDEGFDRKIIGFFWWISSYDIAGNYEISTQKKVGICWVHPPHPGNNGHHHDYYSTCVFKGEFQLNLHLPLLLEVTTQQTTGGTSTKGMSTKRRVVFDHLPFLL